MAIEGLLLFTNRVLWILVAVVHITSAELNANQGYLFTGPKQLLAGTNEKFCVSVKDASHSVATCRLDLIVENSTVASVDHQLNGILYLMTVILKIKEKSEIIYLKCRYQ